MGLDLGGASSIPGMGFVEGLLGVPDEALYGRKPTVPGFTPIKYQPGKEQRLAIEDNLRSFSKAKKLAKKINVFNEEELRKMLKAAIPDYTRIMAAGSDRTVDLLDNKSFSDMLAGRIPTDVSDAVQNSAAAQAIAGGYGGSGMHANLLARDLGLTSLDLIKKGSELTTNAINSAEQWLASSKQLAVPGQFNAASMFLSPSDRVKEKVAVDQWNTANQWNRDWLAEKVSAGPDPAVRGAMDTQMSTFGMILGAAGGLLGGMMGKPGGGGGNVQYQPSSQGQPQYLQNPGFSFNNSGT